MRVAQKIVPGHWTELSCQDLSNIPMQSFSNNCGVFMLMYALYIALDVDFDFSEANMTKIRRWWCGLLLEGSGSPVKRKRPRKMECVSQAPVLLGENKCTMDPKGGLCDLPSDLLRQILLDVVFDEGDGAFLTLSLVCRKFCDIVCSQVFRRKYHLAWLDSITDWKSTSPDIKDKYRVEFKLSTCESCGWLYKDTIGYCGDGKKGVYRAFYSDKEFDGYCSMHCFYTMND